MALPSLSFQRADGNTGSARSAPIGVFAIIAASTLGVAAKPTTATSVKQALTSFGHGELPELAAPLIDAGKPVVLCKVTPTATGTYGTFTTTGQPGSSPSVITAGATKPVDRFRVLIRFTTAGTVGTAGIKYQWSLDNGKTWSQETALGTATSIVIPDTGITVALAAGGILAGEQVKFTTAGPMASLADLTACIAALKATSLDYEAVLIGSTLADAAMIQGLETAVAGFESGGRFKRVLVNVRPWDSSSETAQNYIDALAIISNAGRTGIRVDVGADGAFVSSAIRGIRIWRPTALLLAARIAGISLGTDAAQVSDGPLPNATIVDDDGNPLCWDEASTPGLDDLGFVTLRTFARRAGCYIGNPRVFSPVGSDYVFDQQSRCMNVALERAFDFLTEELSSKKRKDPIPGPQGQVYLLEADVLDMQQRGTLFLRSQLDGEVDGVRLLVSRVDDVGANSGAIVTASVEISSLVYIKGFAVTAKFVRSFNV